jgi:hypothetical protein
MCRLTQRSQLINRDNILYQSIALCLYDDGVSVLPIIIKISTLDHVETV